MPTTNPSNRLAGRVAFITGAARGQGRAFAVRLAAEGADVVAVDSCADAETASYPMATVADLEETARLVDEQGRRCVTAVADVRDYEALQRAVHDGVATLGRLDVVVANAGICTAAQVWEITDAQWREMIAVNLKGVFHTLKASVLVLLEQGQGGSMIVTSSVAGLRGLPFLGHYAAVKHGVVGLVKSLANEVGEYNIRVNSIHPAGVLTGLYVHELVPLVQQHAATLGPILMNAIPEPMAMQPEDVAGAVAWLASDDARYVTGSQIAVDLGTMLR